MGLEIYAQAFDNGASTPFDTAAANAVVEPWAESRDTETDFTRVSRAGVDVGIYGLAAQDGADEGLMFERPAATVETADFIVRVARAGGLVLMPVGTAICIVEEDHRRHVPADMIDDGVVLTRDGSALLTVLEG